MHEPLNRDAAITVPTTISPLLVAEATVNQAGDREAPSDEAFGEREISAIMGGPLRMRELEQAELVQIEKQAAKARKAGSRELRDLRRLTASIAHTRDMETPRAAGTRPTVQPTCMDGLMPTGADGQAAVGQGVVTNPGGAERQQRKRKPAHRDEQR